MRSLHSEIRNYIPRPSKHDILIRERASYFILGALAMELILFTILTLNTI